VAELKQPTLGSAAQAVYNNSQDSLRRRIAIQANTLQPAMYTNFEQIVNKYPGMSKDLVMAMVSQGLTVNTPGIGKIVSMDGISQLKNDALNLDKIKSTVKEDRGFLNAIGDTFRNVIYDPFKGATRLTFAALRHPYDSITAAVRDISTGKTPKPLYGKETQLGALISDILGGKPGVDTGNGFFINPESRVGKDQAKAMSSYGKVFGQSFTIGRFAAKSVGLTPDQTAYRVMSGLVDATLNVATDPSTYLAVGPFAKAARESRKLSKAYKDASPFTKSREVALKEADDVITTLERKRYDLIKKNTKRVEDRVLKKERNLLEVEQQKSDALSKTLGSILNVSKISAEGLKKNPLAQETLSVENITRYISTHDKVESGEFVRAIGKLGADVKNTKGFAEGNIILDELPSAGKLSIGVHGLDEYFVTALTDEPLKVLDLTSDLSSLTGQAFKDEQFRRTQFLDALKALADDTNIERPIRDIFTDVTRLSQEDVMALKGYAWATLFNDQPGNFRTLSDFFVKIGASGSTKAVQLAFDEMSKIWDWDAIANVRSIYGETGGFLLNGVKPYFGIRQAEIGNALAEIADPTNLGPNMLKLVQGLKTNDESIAKAQADLDKAVVERDAFAERVKELDIFREVANQDTATATRLLSDPEYKGLRGVVEINSELSEKTILREWINNQVGLTDYFGGNLADDFSRPLKYLLGRNFARIAEVVAKETDHYKIQNFFGNKLDYDTVKALAAAKTPDEVLGTFLNLLQPGMANTSLFRSLSLRTQTGMLANPAMKLVDSSDIKLVKIAESLERKFGRYYVRSTTVNLNDGTRTVQTVENWLSSARFKIIIGKKAQEAFIADTVRKLYQAESAIERGAVIEKAMVDLVETLSKKMGLEDDKSKQLANIIKFGSKDRVSQTKYSTIQRAEGVTPEFVFAGDEPIKIEKAVSLDQMLNSVAFLPDTKAVQQAFLRYESSKLKEGTKATRALAEELGDAWRTAQLVFRISYILRNIGEMQVRQMFSGHASIFSHPIQFISFVMATSGKNGPLNKFAQKFGKFQYDAEGNKWVSAFTDEDMSDSVKGFYVQTSRGQSTSDYQQSRKSEIWKHYKQVDSGSSEYFDGLAYTLNRMAVDDISASVARLMQLGDEDAKSAFTKRLIDEFDNPDNPIRQMTFGAFESNPGIKRIFLTNAEQPATKDNLNFEKIRAYLFDETPGNETYANRIKAVAGNGPSSNIIMDIISYGEAKIATEAGEFVTITPSLLAKGFKAPGEMGILEAKFAKTLSKYLKPDDLPNSTVIVQSAEYSALPVGGTLNRWIDAFFQIAAKAEGKYNFGPEYVISYWDNIGKYMSMLSVDDLKKLQPNAVKALAPLNKVVGGKKTKGFSINYTLRSIEKEIARRTKSGDLNGTHSLKTISNIASTEASKRVATLFYDAARQKQWSQAVRLIFPFAQAHTNTLSKWAELTYKNPVPIYRFSKAFDALTKEGSNTIYDVTGMTYDDDQGFFYRDPGNTDYKFKMPIVGSVLGALVGKNIDMREALQITAPVQSLNLAFGQANPLIPGFGPAAQIAFIASGKANEFGSAYDVLRDIVTPFGPIQGPEDVVFPSWLKKLVLYGMGDSTTVNRGIKDWASYLASTGEYGQDPLSNDTVRNQLFNDAERLSKSLGMWTAFFQSISPATPQAEILTKIKNPDNKMKFMTGTMLYQYWNKIQEENPGDYGAAVRQFADTFGKNNIMIAISESTSSVSGTDDAWTFLNNNPDTADIYAKSTSDVVPYFFPGGGEFAVKYYNWQKKSGVRRPLSADELEREAEGMIYAMRKDQIAEDQIANGYTQFWYTDQIAQLDAEFDGKPPETITTSTAPEKIDRIGKALQDPAFAESPIYTQISEFYPMFVEFRNELNRLKISNYASLKSKGGYATILRDNLVAKAEILMAENPSFRRMYYGVFASQLEG
jgi:hypothetical protein